MTFDDYGPRSDLARVQAVAEDGYRLYLEFRNGQVGTVDRTDEPFQLPAGSVVLVSAKENHIESAPDEMWPEEPWVGVVRLKLDDLTLVDISGRLLRLETRDDIDYRVGNTVEGTDSSGVTRVLAEDPIRFLDLPSIDEASIEAFKTAGADVDLSFDDFGGLRDVVDRARELIETPLEHHDALKEI